MPEYLVCFSSAPGTLGDITIDSHFPLTSFDLRRIREEIKRLGKVPVSVDKIIIVSIFQLAEEITNVPTKG